MTTDPPPDLHPALAALKRACVILTAQGAFGWVYRGDLDQAREVLASMTPEARQEVSVAAAALSALADEVTTAD